VRWASAGNASGVLGVGCPPGDRAGTTHASLCHMTVDQGGNINGRSRNRASGTTAVAPRPVMPANGNPPIKLPGPPPETSGAAAMPVLGKAAAALSVLVEVAAQLCGTDNAPTEAAWPNPADTVPAPPAPKPAEPADQSAPAPEPRPPVRANPGAAISWLTATTAVSNVFAICSAELAVKAVELAIVIAELREFSDDAADVDDADVDEPGMASCCSAVGTVEVSCESVACVSVATDVPFA
jgi:hypothetical protein